MKQIEFKSSFGRYDYSIIAEIGEEVNEATTKLALQGLANVGFRAVGSEVEKALIKAKFTTKETKRGDIPFSEEIASLLADSAQAKLDKLAKDEGLPDMIFSVLGEHVFGDQSVGKEALKAATAYLAAGKGEAVRAAITKQCGFTFEGETTAEGLARGITALNRSIAAKAAAEAKALMEDETSPSAPAGEA